MCAPASLKWLLRTEIFGKDTKNMREISLSLKVFSYFCTKKKDIFMENKKPLVLISNDDGYHANGIKTLVSFLKDWCDLLVVAPESARSGFACAFSATTPLAPEASPQYGRMMWRFGRVAVHRLTV